MVDGLTRLGRMSGARLTQIMDLLNLAPDIQESILDLRVENGKDRLTERQFRKILKTGAVQRTLCSAGN